MEDESLTRVRRLEEISQVGDVLGGELVGLRVAASGGPVDRGFHRHSQMMQVTRHTEFSGASHRVGTTLTAPHVPVHDHGDIGDEDLGRGVPDQPATVLGAFWIGGVVEESLPLGHVQESQHTGIPWRRRIRRSHGGRLPGHGGPVLDPGT